MSVKSFSYEKTLAGWQKYRNMIISHVKKRNDDKGFLCYIVEYNYCQPQEGVFMKRIFLLTAVFFASINLFAQSGDYTKYERESAVNVINDFKFVPIPGKNYSISETEVTQALYEAVMGENPSYFVGNSNPVENVSWYNGNSGYETHPVAQKKAKRLRTL